MGQSKGAGGGRREQRGNLPNLSWWGSAGLAPAGGGVGGGQGLDPRMAGAGVGQSSGKQRPAIRSTAHILSYPYFYLFYYFLLPCDFLFFHVSSLWLLGTSCGHRM